MYGRILINALLMFALFTTAVGAAERVTVDAEGQGQTKMEALEAAWKEAVRKAIGMFVTSNSQLVNDNLLEKIVVHSRGQVNAYEILSERQDAGVWHLQIRASVDKDILKETADISKNAAAAFNPQQAAAQMFSENQRAASTRETLAANKHVLDFVNTLKYVIKVVPRKNDKGATEYFVVHKLYIDKEKYLAQIPAVVQLLRQVADNVEPCNLAYPEGLRRLFDEDEPLVKTNFEDGFDSNRPNLNYYCERQRVDGKKSFIVAENASSANIYTINAIDTIGEFLTDYTVSFVTKCKTATGDKIINKSACIGIRMIGWYTHYYDYSCVPVIHEKDACLFYIHKLKLSPQELAACTGLEGSIDLNRVDKGSQ